MEVIELTLLSPCVSVREYRGSAQRARGLEYKEEPPIPPLSGGEVTRKTEEKGRGLSERSEFRRPRRRPWRRTQKPDNCGGASWFVLLAAEKNEQIKRISCNRDYLLQEKKIISIQPSPPAVSRSLTGCFVMQNIGEVARSDGGVNKKQQPERFVLLAAEKNEPRIKLHHRYRT